MSLKVLISLIYFILIAHNSLCEDETVLINLKCVKGIDIELISRGLKVDNPRTKIDKVVNSKGTEMNTKNIKILKIRTGRKSVKFVPAGIKANFPDLNTITIESSGLAHLEREDMRQFGADLGFADFSDNSLTALNGNLFEFNPNLKYIHFSHNPLKHVDATIFQQFKNMEKLSIVHFENSNCINKESYSPKTFEWNNYQTCNDEDAKSENSKITDQRKIFFETT